MSITIRHATVEDLPAIDALQSGTPEAAHWSPGSYLLFQTYVAERDGAVIGFICARLIRGVPAEINNLIVHPDHRRQGVGRHLLQTAIEHWNDEVFLEVRESNTGAQELYRQLGFEVVGRRKEYYRDPPEGAVVMRRGS